MLNDDYREILQGLLERDVRFLVVGAYAMAAHGYPRSTGDIDIWVEPSEENSRKIYEALAKFGAPLKDITQETFVRKGLIFQIGVQPRRIDVITEIDGVDFGKAYVKRELILIDGLKIPFLSLQDIIKNKKATGREKDQLDVIYLSKVRKKKSS